MAWFVWRRRIARDPKQHGSIQKKERHPLREPYFERAPPPDEGFRCRYRNSPPPPRRRALHVNCLGAATAAQQNPGIVCDCRRGTSVHGLTCHDQPDRGWFGPRRESGRGPRRPASLVPTLLVPFLPRYSCPWDLSWVADLTPKPDEWFFPSIHRRVPPSRIHPLTLAVNLSFNLIR